MLSALTLPLVAVLLALPGIPHIPGLPNFGMKDLNRLRHKTAAPLDSLPPAWKNASLLALEDQFVQAALPDLAPEPVGMAINPDPRQLRVSFDPDSSVVLYSTQVGDFTVGEATRMPLADYSHDLTRRTFKRLWAEKTRRVSPPARPRPPGRAALRRSGVRPTRRCPGSRACWARAAHRSRSAAPRTSASRARATGRTSRPPSSARAARCFRRSTCNRT